MVGSANISEHYVSRQEGGRVYYCKVGDGEPLVFIPGGGGRSFRQISTKFAQDFTCYIPDLPGREHSDIPRSWLANRIWTIPDYSRAILEVLDAVGIQQCSFVGDHTGAIIALDIAANQPDRVKKLVLDSLGFWDLRRGDIVWEKFFKLQHTDTTSYDVPVEPLLPPWEDAKMNAPTLDWGEWKLADEVHRRDRRWAIAHEYANSHFDVEAIAPKVRAPTLLIYGEREILRRGEQRANDAIEGSLLEIVPDSPKEGVATGGAHVYKPDDFARLALAFLLKDSQA